MKKLILWWKLRQLSSPNPAVRAAAVQTLAGIGDVRAVGPLSELLHDDVRNIRAGAAQALGSIGDTGAVGALLNTLLDEKYWDVRYEVVEALRNIGDPTAVNELVVIMDSDDKDVSLQQFAAWALKEFGWEHLSPAQQAAVHIRRDEWSEVPKRGPAAITPLVNALKKGTPRVRREAADALIKIDDPRALGALLRLLKEPDEQVRRAAAVVLEKHAWARLDEGQLAVVAVTLEKWPAVVSVGVAALEPLAEVMRGRDRSLRQRAVRALAEIGGWRAARILVGAMRDRDVAIRRAATSALGELNDAKSLTVLVSALSDADFEVRQAAATALGKIGWTPGNDAERVRFATARGEQAKTPALGAQAVAPLLEDLKHPSLKSRTLEALIGCGASAVAPLTALLRNPTTAVRIGAAEALGEIRDRRAIPALEGAFADAEIAVRRAAAEALEKLAWQPRDETHRAQIAIALHDWGLIPSIGLPAMQPLLSAINDHEISDQVVRTIEKILRSEAVAQMSPGHLNALVSLGATPTRAGGMPGRPSATSKHLQSAVARRRVSQLARNELQRRGATV